MRIFRCDLCQKIIDNADSGVGKQVQRRTENDTFGFRVYIKQYQGEESADLCDSCKADVTREAIS